MDTKKLRLISTAVALLTLLTFHSCKTDDFLDWKARNQMILEQIQKEPSFSTSASGLVFRILDDQFESEAKPNDNSLIRCDRCDGWLVNGYQFQEGEIYSYLSQLVAGCQEGLKMIHTHGTIELYVPYELAYGEEGFGTKGTPSFIPPYSTLHFIIHLSSVN